MAIVKAMQGGTVTFKANEFGHKGAEFEEGMEEGKLTIPPADEYWFTYWLRLKPGWIEGWGGKLPGLAGGTATSGGADITPNGWSDRVMWGEMRDGLREYRYEQDRKSSFGDWYPFAGDRFLDVGKWHRMTQWVVINRPNKQDGQVKWWLNDELVLHETKIRWRGDVSENKARVDRVRMTIFLGGGSQQWAVDKETSIEFSDFYVTDCEPAPSDDHNAKPVCKGEIEKPPENEVVATISIHPGYAARMAKEEGGSKLVRIYKES